MEALSQAVLWRLLEDARDRDGPTSPLTKLLVLVIDREHACPGSVLGEAGGGSLESKVERALRVALECQDELVRMREVFATLHE